MAITYKVLAQSAPSATTNTDVYTVGAGKQTVISTITVCNRSASAATYRIAVRPDGATIANQHYLVYDGTLPANDTINLTIGITVDASDVVTVYASSANLSFNLFGTEIA
jgi:hypothetical protein